MEIILRATAIYFFLWMVTRAVGKRELAEMTAFELILIIVMGDLIQQGVTQEDMSLVGAVLAVGTITLWIMVFSWVSWRFPRSRPALEGVPVIVVRDGVMLEQAMALERLTDEEVREAARNHGIGDLAQVRMAVLEPDGKLSFITRDGAEQTGEDEKHQT
jgi:uncharacterized membrane protein YcaP (DUF421 family)